MSDTDDRIIQEFLADSLEGLDRLDRDLVELERDPRDPQLLADAFRTLHTIKGTCAFLGFVTLERVAHAGESLMSRLRSGSLTMDSGIAGALLGIADAARAILTRIRSTGTEGAGDFSAAIARVEALLAPAPAAARGGAKRRAAGQRTKRPISRGAAAPAASKAEAREAESGFPEASRLRVDVSVLDQLMDLVGELVLARNQTVQLIEQEGWSSMPRAGQRLDHVTSRLQEQVMRTRMQPVSKVLDRLPRLVRDVATECGKRVKLHTEGAGTELDNALLEALRDPLLHLVRNAVDHGIETPDARTAQGKPAEGRLDLRAFHEGGQVHLEISDDGQGISLDHIRRIAAERGVVSPDDAVRLSPREWLRLIFLPGFSTASRVTRISGRGVGMDVVRAGIEGIGGSIEVESTPGRGTTFRIRVPLTLAILPALIVEQNCQRYAIPQADLRELVRLGGQAGERLETVYDAPVLRLRGRLLPLLFLGEQLGLRAPDQRTRRGAMVVAVVQSGGRRFGIVVDGVHDTEEIVVKPLAEALRATRVYAGATILGDGRVTLILDLAALARRAGLASLPAEEEAPAPLPVERPHEELLLVRLREGWPAAVRVSQIARIEEVAGDAIEFPGPHPALRWRDQVLPIIPLVSALSAEPAPIAADRAYHVLVHAGPEGHVGFLVERVEDIVRAPLEAGPRGQGPSRLVVRERVTELVDLDHIARAWRERAAEAA